MSLSSILGVGRPASVGVVIIMFKAVRMVPQGYEWTVERFGKLHPHPDARACTS